MIYPEDLQDLLQLLRDNGVVEYKTPELSLLLTIKPDKTVLDQTVNEEHREPRRSTPLPPLPKGSGYASLPSEFIPSFPGSAKPIPTAVRVPVPTPAASSLHDSILEAAEAQFIASNAEG